MKFTKVVKAGWKSDMDLTVSGLRYLLEITLDELKKFDDNTPCERYSSTSEIHGNFIGIPSWGYIDMLNPVADEKGE